ncbi:Phage tail protein (Tail_P2_I) [Pelagimonas phthalicica]|uniref:Phage tail protein (Tail_P2_I) n=1 Tax=Pelagimonas phthalicica TaxID=1037362 RepID=A0A238JAQ9_9RHOB|nr:phage tail protein I [Pelagimonas phthalicica]TDS94181.1 phage tail P2-like protein [Pelagimonas phthalicica]SMX27294.1 Phage tail protein (Tail_P2_I) [Pelagimonas phthalicica]
MSDLPTLLPPNARKVEYDLEQLSSRLQGMADPVAALWDAEICPVHLLPYLAWAFSVEVWDASWSEQQRRQVVIDAIKIHRRKGTVGAVRKALAGIGFRTDLTEWFETGGEPHTFRIDAFGDDVFEAGFGINPELFHLVTLILVNVKPERSHFTLRIGEKKGGTIETGVASCQRVKNCRVATPAVPSDVHQTTINVRANSVQRAISRQNHTFSLGDAA